MRDGATCPVARRRGRRGRRAAAAALSARARPVINATGVVLHTNLGRAPLSRRAVERARGLARGYCDLDEIDLADGPPRRARAPSPSAASPR